VTKGALNYQEPAASDLARIKPRLAIVVPCFNERDADLQHDEQAIYSFLDKYRQGAEIVFRIRHDPGNVPVSKKLGSSVFYWTMSSPDAKAIKDHPDYRLVYSAVKQRSRFHNRARAVVTVRSPSRRRPYPR
jgi:hypothetical protein